MPANDNTARPEWYSCWIRLHANCCNYIAFAILATLKSIMTNIGGTTICGCVNNEILEKAHLFANYVTAIKYIRTV